MPPFEQARWPSRQGGWRAAARCGAAALAGVALVAGAASSFTPDLQPVGWVTRPVLSSHNLLSGNETIFRTDFRFGEWSGSLHANQIDAQGEVLGSSPWPVANAGVLLNTQNFDSGRRIVTRHATSGAGVPLRWVQIAPSQQTALGDATKGPKILNFVRGDRANEDPAGDKFRRRINVLGETQHATLLHWRHSSSVQRLYVGANDGMLHVFDALNGQEVFAYVPSMLLARLPLLTANPYVSKLYVDGPLAVSEVLLSGTRKTLLVGGLGGGGRGLFMLDVTDPVAADENAAASKIKWEITPTSTGFANLGYTYAMPRFARLTNGTAVVIVGNGYLNTGNGRASLFVINADTGALVREIDTGAGSLASPNGLSSPTLVDSDGDGRVDMAYAGDLDGKLWKFDLKDASPSNFSATLLFTTSPVQPITVAPVVQPHSHGGRMVMFGTGRTLLPADATDTAAYAAYGIWDGAPVANTTILAQTVSATSYAGQPMRFASSNVPVWASGGHRGWRTALPAGERIVGEAPFMNDDRYYFMSTNPTLPAPTAGDSTGGSWLTELNFLSGGNPASSIYDLNGDGLINDSDRVSGQVINGKWLGTGLHSQPVLVDLSKFSLTVFAQQSNITSTVPGGGGPGVSGGHFDVDLYDRRNNTAYANRKHTHEYDDKFNVTGVNFLNASEPAFNLSNALATSTAFKVLLVNQYLNPAAQVSVGGQAFVSVKTYGNQATATDATALLASLPTYTRSNVNTLAFKLPLDGFASKDWWGAGDVRSGLIPSQTGCVNKVSTTGVPGRPGPNGERFNGALTIQLIRSDTPASALELNYPAGGAKYGWRVKTANFTSVVAEYTTFWHHDNGRCYGDSGWVKNAPEDFSGGGKTSTPAFGSADPTDGAFGGTPPPSGVSVTSVSSTVNGDVTSYLISYSDGKSEQTTVTNNGNGTESVTVVGRDGKTSSFTRQIGGTAIRGVEEILLGSRRINWREIVRP